MMIRPRRYSTLNRVVARSITYSLRNYNRKKKYNTNNTYQNNSSVNGKNNNRNNVNSSAEWLVICFIITVFIMFLVAISN